MRVDPKLVIASLQANDGKVRQTARELGISPGTVRNWKRRATTGLTWGKAHQYSTRGLERRSTTPKSSRRGTTLSTEQQYHVPRIRRERGHGAVKIAAQYAANDPRSLQERASLVYALLSLLLVQRICSP